MSVSGIESVLDFLRKNGFFDSESALMEDLLEQSEFRSFDFEKFIFPMLPPPPPAIRQADDGGDDSSEELVSFCSCTTDLCSSEFTNPYGLHITTGVSSQASSDRLSQFGTACDYQDFDMQNDLHWYNEKDEDYIVPPHFGRPDSISCPSEDKFVMTLETGKQISQLGLIHMSEGFQTVDKSNYLDKPWSFNVSSLDEIIGVQVTDYHHSDENVKYEGIVEKEKKGSAPVSDCCLEGGFFDRDPKDHSLMNLKVADVNDFKCKRSATNDWAEEFKAANELHIPVTEKDFLPNGKDDHDGGNARELAGDSLLQEGVADEEEDVTADQLLMYDSNEEEHELFNLRIIHRKNRTGFEENKDLPIVLNSIIAGRYYVTEYLGSAAFSRVVQAQDLHTEVAVCLKIIKNDKDFFDQSLDEIKLLKFVNKHDPGDERHILRLYDYFYYQEHLFIVCELLRANLYEFQKYNRESGGEPYFTLSRLQHITRQCLEALEYLHHLGVIHCDLKPENILIKSYTRCEIKVIDLGSSCFQTDNLCLYVQSRSYRAPEVILGLPYDQKIDLWSLGCILAELCSGEVLFPNDALVMLLARMIGMLGPIDMEMLVKGQETDKHFTEEYDLYLINEETNQLEYVIPEESSLENHLQVSDTGFINFVTDLLEINPERRPTAREALEHPWLSHQYV
ncbi:putative serine/threonine-protein kinase dyrk2 [Camellia lanceoleosa]|uniref:Serine/threonine-protein kinase dyrk2 n=1 Tax=Camellia lanceoleosa TaxID=1840588 RepID=A0ACC0IZI4_9ERIC|nr:putative serine/threonine-protein kinase dyrk2 [Camellia lanceoleosa]